MSERISRYILNAEGHPVPEPDLLKWARWYERAEWHVGDDTIGGARVSTVFLGLDHAMEGPPILWETLVFGGVLDMEMSRCAGSREQAEQMHADMVARVTNSMVNL